MARVYNQPTEAQAKWVRENYQKVRNCDIAAKFGVSLNMVVSWYKHLGIKKESRVYAGKKGQSTKRQKYVNQPIKYLSAEYSNQTVYQHQERILSIQI